jgi:plasmid stabilization system protein ParE
MPRIVRTAEAEEDLIGIWLYIAQDNSICRRRYRAERR